MMNKEFKNDKWVLRQHFDEIHIEFYTLEDIEKLRQLLIKDCHDVFKLRGQTISGFTFERIINKRFGVDK